MIEVKKILLILITTFVLYVLSLLVGILIGKRQKVKIQWLIDNKKYFIDPFSFRFKKIFDKNLGKQIENRNRLKVFLILFLNNFLIGAFITRTLYGVVFFIPILFVLWEGFAHGLIYSKFRELNRIYYLETVGYLIASVAGTKIGINLLEYFFYDLNNFSITSFMDLILLYPVVFVLIFLGAAFETRLLTTGEKQTKLTAVDIKRKTLTVAKRSNISLN